MMLNDPLANRLRQAIAQDELVLHYQPIVDASTTSLQSAEALVRWQDPDLGLIPPAVFIPMAEQCGLIRSLTLWVVKQALQQAQQWSQMGSPSRIAVNLSPSCLLDPGFPDAIVAMLEAYGLAPDSLEFELTESEAIEDVACAARILEALRDLGIRISLDDFGTGNSSLDRLKRIPVDAIKIDRAYVQDLLDSHVDRAIVTSVMSLAHKLGCTVVAEGVENEETLVYLKLTGCDAIQGYWISRPLSAAEFTRRWIASECRPIDRPDLRFAL
jgi:EAL domain-containing protein (putative c-di-GMP-specific phosphodiesterase class I)